MYRFGNVQKKVLLLLFTGLALGSAASPPVAYRVLRESRKEWRKVSQKSFNRSLRKLRNEKLLQERKLKNGSFVLELTKEGKREAELQSLLGNALHFQKPKKWDGKWRVVSFDIPEDYKRFRGILRSHLYALDFYRLQLSLFISPHPFEKGLSRLVDLYHARPYVRIMTVLGIDNEKALKRHFSL